MSAGCVARRVNLTENSTRGARTEFVASIGNDDKGLPVPGPTLARRPSKPGDHFTILRLTDGRPELSCDVAIIGRDPDFQKPIKAVYKWTGKGFRLGVSISAFLFDAVLQGGGEGGNPNPKGIVTAVVVMLLPIPAGTAGGLVVGVADGLEKTFEEVGKSMTKDEKALTCTTYEYDDRKRLLFMHMYLPDYTRELVRTRFEYEGNNTVPAKAVVRNRGDGQEREIR